MKGHDSQQISPWVRHHASRIAPSSKVLDLACGNGRHARYLAQLGHPVTAIDIDLSGVTDLTADKRFILIEHDLENSPWPFADGHFGGIIVTNYLFRPLLPHLVTALINGGTLIYDTFAVGNERFGHPRNPSFLLNPGELLDVFAADFRILAYDHGRIDDPRPAMRQRLCAIRRANPTPAC